MNLLIFEESDFIAANKNEFFVGAAKTQHLQVVLKADVGSKIKIGQLNGKIGSGEIKSFADGGTVIEIKELNQDSVQPEFDLILALPRPQMLKRILENITTLGVRRLYLINSKRVEKSFFSSPVLKTENLKKHLVLGLEQAAVTIMPEVEIFNRFKDFTSRVLADKSLDKTLKVVAHTGGQTSPARVINQRENSCDNINNGATVAVGPEGGWLDSEVEIFEQFGFVQVSLGKRILRVETAVYALLAQMQIVCGCQGVEK